MNDKDELIKKVLQLRKERDLAIDNYNLARNELKSKMKQEKLHIIDNGEYQFIIEKRHKINYDLLRQKYPEIFAKGMVYRFDDLKAREYFPRDIIMSALDECAEGGTEFVKIQRHPKRRKRNKTG